MSETMRDGKGISPEPGTVRIERVLPGPVERVWNHLVDSDKRRLWLAAGPLEPFVGGRVEHLFRHAELSAEQTPSQYRDFEASPAMHGRVTRFEPPHALAYGWPGDDGSSEVTFEFFAEDGDIRLVLTHRRLADGKTMVSVASGWDAHLGILIDRLNGVDPRGFWSTHERLMMLYGERFTGKENT